MRSACFGYDPAVCPQDTARVSGGDVPDRRGAPSSQDSASARGNPEGPHFGGTRSDPRFFARVRAHDEHRNIYLARANPAVLVDGNIGELARRSGQ